MYIVYLLKEEAPHFGIRIPKAEEMLIVQDNQKEMTVMYMRSGENNMVSATRFSRDTFEYHRPGIPSWGDGNKGDWNKIHFRLRMPGIWNGEPTIPCNFLCHWSGRSQFQPHVSGKSGKYSKGINPDCKGRNWFDDGNEYERQKRSCKKCHYGLYRSGEG